MHELIDKETTPNYIWGDNCTAWLLVDNDQLSVKQETMPGGTKEKLHFHVHSQQFFYVLRGTATFYIEDTQKVLGEQQGILVQQGTKHAIANETIAQLDFLVVSQPSINNDRINIGK